MTSFIRSPGGGFIQSTAKARNHLEDETCGNVFLVPDVGWPMYGSDITDSYFLCLNSNFRSYLNLGPCGIRLQKVGVRKYQTMVGTFDLGTRYTLYLNDPWGPDSTHKIFPRSTNQIHPDFQWGSGEYNHSFILIEQFYEGEVTERFRIIQEAVTNAARYQDYASGFLNSNTSFSDFPAVKLWPCKASYSDYYEFAGGTGSGNTRLPIGPQVDFTGNDTPRHFGNIYRPSSSMDIWYQVESFNFVEAGSLPDEAFIYSPNAGGVTNRFNAKGWAHGGLNAFRTPRFECTVGWYRFSSSSGWLEKPGTDPASTVTKYTGALRFHSVGGIPVSPDLIRVIAAFSWGALAGGPAYQDSTVEYVYGPTVPTFTDPLLAWGGSSGGSGFLHYGFHTFSSDPAIGYMPKNASYPYTVALEDIVDGSVRTAYSLTIPYPTVNLVWNSYANVDTWHWSNNPQLGPYLPYTCEDCP